MEENKPPAKLTQAKLTFFNPSPDIKTLKNPAQGQGKKRKNSNSDNSDSPQKLTKLSKPLIPLENAESEKAKGKKVKKHDSAEKSGIDNDHEVSSSSEAENNGAGKPHNGSFMERFVLKVPQDRQQEISSTNEILDVSSASLPHDDSIAEENDGTNTEKDDQQKAADEKIPDSDCIVIDEEPELDKKGKASKETSTKKTVKSCRRSNSSKKNGKSIASFMSPKSAKAVSVKNASKNTSVAEDSTDDLKDTSQVTGDDEMSIADPELDESVNESVGDSSFMPSVESTPIKSKTDVKDDTGSIEATPKSNQEPKTPNTGSGKKGRKVDLAKKAEKEAMKQKLKEEKEKERLEKKRKLEEEKTEKERMKKEKKEAKEKEKQEQKEKLEMQKLEKEKAKEEEKKKKEEERQKREEEKQKKEEEKKKKQAALEEEKKKKDEERKQKEEEKKQKEEERLRLEEEKKRADEKRKQAFQSFFIKPKETPQKPTAPKTNTGMFIPFEVKKDMSLAPAVRRAALSEEKKNLLDQLLASDQQCSSTYLEQLQNGEEKPHKTGKVLRKNPQPPEDIEIVHDSEALKKVLHVVKLLQFHTDYRPPYYGTWRKKAKLSSRNPWMKDESLFDYEVDSDEEWEEEEPGESLSASDGEEDKGEDAADDDDDDGWMVPHGYLSEDEGCNLDDEITPEKLKIQQLAKAKAWEDELKQKLHVAPSVIVGCFFEHSPSATMSGDVRLLYEYRGVVLAPCTPISTSLYGNSEQENGEESVLDTTATTPNQKGIPKMPVPEEAMPDLVQLVHGNTWGIKRLIREFRVFWLKKKDGDVPSDNQEEAANESLTEKDVDTSCMNDSVNESFNNVETDEKMANDESEKLNSAKTPGKDGIGCSISKRQLELKITSMAVRERRPGFNKICWYVHENILRDYGMLDLKVPNPRMLQLSGTPKSATLNSSKMNSGSKNTDVQAEPGEVNKMEVTETPTKPTPKDQRAITDFALSKAELLKISANEPTRSVEESKPTPLAPVPETPQDTKRPNNQRSIMDFTKKAGSGSKKAKSEGVKNSPSNNMQAPACDISKTPVCHPVEVIDVNSNSSVGDKSDATCAESAQGEKSTPAIPSMPAISQSENEINGILKKADTSAENNPRIEEPMETDTSANDASTGTKSRASDMEKKNASESKCIVIE